MRACKGQRARCAVHGLLRGPPLRGGCQASSCAARADCPPACHPRAGPSGRGVRLPLPAAALRQQRQQWRRGGTAAPADRQRRGAVFVGRRHAAAAAPGRAAAAAARHGARQRRAPRCATGGRLLAHPLLLGLPPACSVWALWLAASAPPTRPPAALLPPPLSQPQRCQSAGVPATCLVWRRSPTAPWWAPPAATAGCGCGGARAATRRSRRCARCRGTRWVGGWRGSSRAPLEGAAAGPVACLHQPPTVPRVLRAAPPSAPAGHGRGLRVGPQQPVLRRRQGRLRYHDGAPGAAACCWMERGPARQHAVAGRVPHIAAPLERACRLHPPASPLLRLRCRTCGKAPACSTCSSTRRCCPAACWPAAAAAAAAAASAWWRRAPTAVSTLLTSPQVRCGGWVPC